jgi:hypothetical protein
MLSSHEAMFFAMAMDVSMEHIAIHAYIDIPSIRGGRHLQNGVHF